MKYSQKDLIDPKTYNFLITEKVYSIPSTFQKLFFDVYALYDLYWRFGKGKSEYGYTAAVPEIAPDNLSKKIDYMFEEAVYMMAKIMIIGMARIVSDEAENAEDDLWVNQDELKQWLNENNMSYLIKNESYKTPTPKEIINGKPSFDNMSYFFLAPFWGSEKSGWVKEFGGLEYTAPETGNIQKYDVGGEAWSNIASLSQKLLNFYRNKKTISILQILDRIFHVHHNNGSIFNKTELLKLNIRLTKEDLDFRRDARSFKEFKGKVSPQVEKIINAAARFE